MNTGRMIVGVAWALVAVSGCAGDSAVPVEPVQPVSTETSGTDLEITLTPLPTTTTTTVPATAPSSTVVEEPYGWFDAVLDPGAGVVYQVFSFVDTDDAPVVVYQREIARDAQLLRLARCLDPMCVEVELVDVPTPSDAWPVAVAVRSDGSPVIGLAPVGFIPDGEARLLVCEGPGCETVSGQSIAGVGVSAVAVDGSDRPLMVVSEWPDPNRNEAVLSLALCADGTCGEYRLVELARVANGVGTVRIAFSAGAPVIAYEVFSEGEMGATGLRIVACSDADCTDVTETEIVDRVDSVNPDLPMFAYLDWGTQAVRLVRCLDPGCARAVEAEVYQEFEGRMLAVASSQPAELGDGSVVVLVEAMPRWSEAESGASNELFAVRCLDSGCDDVLVSDAPLATGDATSGLWLEDGLALVVFTGEGTLCDPYGENCADPEEEGLGSLDISLCRGGECLEALATEPLGASTVDTSGAPLDGDVVFVREGDIWLIESGSTQPVNLTGTWEYWEGGPVWSPDGERIVFHANRADPSEGFDIYVMNRDGSGATRITEHPAGEYFPSWSPDGTRLVFSRDNAGDDLRHLVILDLESGVEFELTDEAHNGDIPRWSPDGTMIAFGRRTSGGCEWGEPCNSSIFVIDVDGTDERQLTFAEGTHWFPDWSPDGTSIAYHGTADDPLDRSDWNVYVVDVDDGTVTRVTGYDGVDQSPAWSPDGTRIIFESDRSGGNAQLYTMAPDGTAVAVVIGATGAMYGIDWID